MGIMRLAVLSVPFQRTADFLGLKPVTPSVEILNSGLLHDVAAISWSLRAMAFRTPWESACLTQALAGMVMLQRRNIPAQMYLGVAKGESAAETMAAHAWLKCGHVFVTGEGGHERFAVISSFSGEI